MKNKIICGDCLEVMKDIPDKSIDLLITDPPYFLPVNCYVGVRGKTYKKTLADTSILLVYFKNVFSELDRILKKNGTLYVFCDAQSYPIFYQAMFPYCKHVRMIIWDKMVSYNGYTWRHQHEIIAWGERSETKRVPTGDGDIIKCRGVLQKNRNHPAEKPVEILEKLIHKHEGKIILDPFAGSGSSLVASKNLGRDFMGIELSEEYCKIAEQRLKQKPLF
jgi:site-specific DNA-methyltransferase (adenine-specific)